MNCRPASQIALLGMLLFACGPAVSNNDNLGNQDGGPSDPDANWTDNNNHCPAGQATVLSGVVTAPNGIDPVADAVVFVPSGPLGDFQPGASCDTCGVTDAAYVSTRTGADGRFTLAPIPTDANAAPGFKVPVVSQKGRFRKVAQVTVDTPCTTNTPPAASFQFPSKNDPSGYDRVPKIAVSSGDYDIMECVLLQLGLDPTAVDMYDGVALPHSWTNVPTFDKLLKDGAKMKTYNIIFIDCAANTYENLLSDATVKANIEAFVSAGGRLYVTDWSYDYVEQTPQFSPVINFEPDPAGAAPEPRDAAAIGTGGITTEAQVLDPQLLAWLKAVQQKTGDSILGAGDAVHVEDFLGGWVMQRSVDTGSIANVTHAKTWLSGTVDGSGVPSQVLPLTTTFDYKQCGRVLYSSYHTRGRPTGGIFSGPKPFPAVCGSGTKLNPQERVLEYLVMQVGDCIVVIN